MSASDAAAPRPWRKLGVIAGAGPLPAKVLAAAHQAGREGYIVRLAGSGARDEAGAPAADAVAGMGEAGRIIRLLKENDCDAVVLAGLVDRPDFSALKLDWRGAALLPRVVAAAARGDGALLDLLVGVFEAEGFRVLGADEIIGDVAVGEGIQGAYAPLADDLADMRKAAALIDALGPFDVGQGAVVAGGLVLAVEAAEGTDAMLARVASLPSSVRGLGERKRRGVLVKRPKPGQELRVDLPTIGRRTIEGVRAAGLAGVAVEADRALMMDRDAALAEADAAEIFVYGFAPDALARK
ncbi:MAG: LpxI family protein [Parvularculaceae bacterium]